MKKTTLTVLVMLATAIAILPSCAKEGCTDPSATNYDPDAKKSGGDCIYDTDSKPQFTVTRSGKVVTVEGATEADFTFYADSIYMMKGFIYVRSGATLTIEPGTVIKGEIGTKGTLIIERGGKVMAEGTVDKPIVFTSGEEPGFRDYGDWGGVIICGKAPINLPGGEGVVEGGTAAFFGGNDPADNSGIFKYARIEFAGIPFQPNQEINGLTMAGVGTGTTIEYVQVSYCGDDSFEWFGGTVNGRYLIAFRGWDDEFDSDNGHTGLLQFLVGLRDPNIADVSASNGFESDNDGGGSTATPFTNPIYSNVSIFGPNFTGTTTISDQYRSGIHLRRLSKLNLFNSVVTGYPEGLYVARNTEVNLSDNSIQIQNTVLAGCDANFATDLTSSYDLAAWFNTPSFNNSIYSQNSDLMLTDPFNLNNPDFRPATGSPLLSGASFANPRLNDPYFQQVNYKGAFDGVNDWTQGWTNWDPQNTVYE